MSELLDRESIVELLTQLGRRLDDKGMSADLYVVGGTAMLLAYQRSRLTRDIDAVTVDQEVVAAEARSMAEGRRGLPADWLNSRVGPMLPQVFDEGQMEALAVPGLTVNVASPEHLLAMKVRAARGDRDVEDILLLCRHLGIARIEEVFAIADQVWGPGMIRDDAQFLVRESLAAAGYVG
ncbi:MAG: hypothetical protein RLZ55_489 [Actinomycetota bacterium]